MDLVVKKAMTRVGILALYALISAAVFIAHGPQPELTVDHIAYMKLANEIHDAHPDGRYFEGVRAVRSYAALLACLYDWTGDHIRSMKLVLAIVTFLSLWAFEGLMGCFTSHRAAAVLFSVLSLFHISFGAVFWGLTSFQASLSRSLIIPPLLLLLRYFWMNEHRRRRSLVFPALVYLSFLHMSSLYILVTLACYEGIRACGEVARKIRPDISTWILEGGLSLLAFWQMKPLIMICKIPVLLNLSFASSARACAVGSREAWAAELFAQPWRNFPPPPATLLMVVASIGMIFLLSVFSVWIRRRFLGEQDRQLLRWAAAILLCAYGVQFVLWMLRSFTSVYPYNFEEVRLIGFLAVPMILLVFKLVEYLWNRPGRAGRLWAVVTIGLFLAQPIRLVDELPRPGRQALYDWLLRAGWLENYESLRAIYARSVLKLDDPSVRFYYSMTGILQWLTPRVTPQTVILSDRSDLYLLNAWLVGSANSFLDKDVRTPQRQTWMKSVQQLHAALSAHDEAAVERLMEEYGADYAVVPWTTSKALFAEGRYSVIAR